MGEWIRRKADEHRHDAPHLASEAKGCQVGDIWQCNCGVKLEIVGFDSGSQWDPYPTSIRWRKIQEHGIYAPVTK